MILKTKKTMLLIAGSAFLSSAFSCSTNVEQVTIQYPSSAETTAPSSDINTQSTEASSSSVTEDIKTTSPTEPTTEAASDIKKSTVKGNIYDTDGRLLVSGEAGKRIYADDHAIPFANIATEMSDGYDKCFDDILTSSDNNGNARSVKLTLDAEIQDNIYEYMKNKNMKGSAVVMRSDGSVMAQVSYPSYDPGKVKDQKYYEELAWGECGNKAFQNYEPGSCFKIMSEVLADKHGITSLTDEGTWKFDGTSIVNWDHDKNSGYPMQRSLSSAFVNSSNIFFAKAFDQIGTENVLKDLEEIFHFTSDIECDFGVINNNIEIYCPDDLRRTAFGQSYVLTCPIYLAALGREAAFGEMVRPFVLQDIVQTEAPENSIGKGSTPIDKIASIPEELRPNLQNGMSAVAADINISVPEGYSALAKTGTAETWVNDFLYITGCVKNNSDTGTKIYDDYSSYDGSYVIVMMLQNPKDHGYEFASQSAVLYQGIIDAVVGK